MSDSGGESKNNEIRPRVPGPRATGSNYLWFGAVLFILLVGFRYGMGWVWFAALVGLAIITLYWAAVWSLASIRLFRSRPKEKTKKCLAWELGRKSLLEKWSEVVARLSKTSRGRYNRLHLRVSRLGDLSASPQTGSLLRPGEYLLWLYLKLLMARDLLEEGTASSSEAAIAEERRRILQELEEPGLTSATRQSKEETVLILDQRMETARSRSGRIQEIESDLTRIEQKVALMIERAAQYNIMGDSGRRINFSDELQTGASLSSLTHSQVEELDSLVTAQVCA